MKKATRRAARILATSRSATAKRKAARILSALGAAAGGHARAANMTAEARSEAGRAAVQARWDRARRAEQEAFRFAAGMLQRAESENRALRQHIRETW